MSKLKSNDINEVIDALIGQVEPLGDSRWDRDRLQNLRKLEEVADRVIDTILLLIPYHTSYEDSVSEIGKEALKWAEFWKEELSGELGER